MPRTETTQKIFQRLRRRDKVTRSMGRRLLPGSDRMGRGESQEIFRQQRP